MTCPVISAFSELKQFSDYPICTDKCGWWDPYQSCCSVRSIANGLHTMAEKQSAVSDFWSSIDYSTKQDLSQVLRGLSNLLERLGMKVY